MLEWLAGHIGERHNKINEQAKNENSQVLKMSEKAAIVQRNLWKTFRKPGELLLKTNC